MFRLVNTFMLVIWIWITAWTLCRPSQWHACPLATMFGTTRVLLLRPNPHMLQTGQFARTKKIRKKRAPGTTMAGLANGQGMNATSREKVGTMQWTCIGRPAQIKRIASDIACSVAFPTCLPVGLISFTCSLQMQNHNARSICQWQLGKASRWKILFILHVRLEDCIVSLSCSLNHWNVRRWQDSSD